MVFVCISWLRDKRQQIFPGCSVVECQRQGRGSHSWESLFNYIHSNGEQLSTLYCSVYSTLANGKLFWSTIFSGVDVWPADSCMVKIGCTKVAVQSWSLIDIIVSDHSMLSVFLLIFKSAIRQNTSPPLIFKGTVLRDRFRKCWRKLTDLGLNKGRGWFLNFSEAPLIFGWNKTSSFR